MADDVKAGPAKYKRKDAFVEARQYNGPVSLNVDSVKKGQQVARAGDFLVTDPAEVKKQRDFEKDNDLDEQPLKKGSVYVVTKEEFLGDFDLVDDAGEVADVTEKKGLYDAPHFDTLEEAQQAAANSTSYPFHCTIKDNTQLYSIQKDGMVTQVPIVPPDPTQDIGPTHAEGARLEEVPQSLQNQAVHDTGPTPDTQTSVVVNR